MGLASKMAQTGQGGGAQPPPAQPSYGAPPSSVPPSYGVPPSSAPGQQQYGAPGQFAPPPGAAPPRIDTSGRPASQQYPPSPAYTPSPSQAGFGDKPRPQSYAPPPGPPPGGAPYGQPQQQAPFSPQQQQFQQQPAQYGAPPPATPVGAPMDPRQVQSVLEQCIQDQKIHAFYPPGSLQAISHRVAQSGALDAVSKAWNLPKELAIDLIKLSLFDVVILVDDSGSMAFEEGGTRIDDLKLILSRVAYVASLFDDDGIQIRFLNNQLQGNGIRTEQDTLNLLQGIRFSGLTPLGTSLDQKILQPLVLGPARAGQLQKPVLVIAITDGTPAGEPRDMVTNVIINASRELARTRYGPDALSFTFAQVGDDAKAQAFLSELDTHPVVGGLVDCISNYEREEEEMMRKSGLALSPDLWLLKLIMGGIDSSYDEQDE